MSEPCQRCGGTGKEPDHRAIGQRMRTLRERAGMTLRRVAGAMEITPSYLCDLELGRRQWRKELIDRMTKLVHP